MGQHKAPDGKWFRCPRTGCGFCHKDLYTISSDRRHFGRAHPGYAETFRDIAATVVEIPEAEGQQWRKEHPEEYRWRIDAVNAQTHGMRSRPRPKNSMNLQLSTDNQSHGEAVGAENITQPQVEQREASSPVTEAMTQDDSKASGLVSSDPDAMEIDTPVTSSFREPSPDSKYDFKWKCYVCNKYFTARSSVKAHFLSTHLATHHQYQPSRVPKFAFDKDTKNVVKLVTEALLQQHPTFTGICVELRQLIFEQLLSISQHPEQTDDVFSLNALRVSGALGEEAKAVLNHYNLFIRFTVYYSGAGALKQDSQLARSLSHDIYAVLEPNIVDDLEIEPAVHLMSDHESTVDGPKVSSSFLFAYNESTFAGIILVLFAERLKFPGFSVKFRSPFAALRHQRAATSIVQYLGYLRLSAQLAISDTSGLVNSRDLRQKISSDLSSYEGVSEILKQVIRDAESLMVHKEYSSSLATLRFGVSLWEIFDEKSPVNSILSLKANSHLWKNVIDDLCCRCHLAGCHVINNMATEAAALGQPQNIPLDYLQDAALFWGTHAFDYAVILDPFRGQAHLARGTAYRNLAKFLKRRDQPGDDAKASQYRLEARKDFFFASLLLQGDQKLEARGQQALLDYYDKAQTDGIIAGLIHDHPIQYGQTFTGDRRLLEQWDGYDLSDIVDRRQRPPGWELNGS